MDDPRPRNERKALALCALAFDKLDRDDGTLRAMALAQIERWERQRLCSRYYIERWRELLAMDANDARRIALAPTDEGQALRANNPFPGFFSRDERAQLRRTA